MSQRSSALHDLVEAGGEGAGSRLIGGRLEKGASARRASPVSRASDISQSSIDLFGVGLAGFAFACLALLGGGLDLLGAARHRRPRSASEAPSASSCAVALVALVLVVLAALAAELVAHFEGGEQVADGVGEAALILDRLGEAREIARRRAPRSSRARARRSCGSRRRGIAGQPFAHHQRDRVLERRVGAVGDLLIVAAVVAVLEHGGEIARRRRVMRRRAERLDARLLDGVEDGAGVLALGRVARGGRCGIVAGEAERDRIADAAGDGDVALGQLARRLGQPRLVARQHRPVGGEA